MHFQYLDDSFMHYGSQSRMIALGLFTSCHRSHWWCTSERLRERLSIVDLQIGGNMQVWSFGNHAQFHQSVPQVCGTSEFREVYTGSHSQHLLGVTVSALWSVYQHMGLHSIKCLEKTSKNPSSQTGNRVQCNSNKSKLSCWSIDFPPYCTKPVACLW